MLNLERFVGCLGVVLVMSVPVCFHLEHIYEVKNYSIQFEMHLAPGLSESSTKPNGKNHYLQVII